MTEAEILDLADSLSCKDEIIKNVADQIIGGCTELGSWGFTCGPLPLPGTPLDEAQRRIAKTAGDVAKREIERLERELQHQIESEKRYCDWAWEMYHAWPDGCTGSRPKLKGAE